MAHSKPPGGVGSPITIGGLFGVLQALDDLSHVDTLFGSEGGPGLTDGLAPGGPISTGSIDGGKRREGRTILDSDGLASDLGVVATLPLGSVFTPCLGCKGESDG